MEVGCAQRLLAENSKEALHLVQPGCARRCVVKLHQRIGVKPGFDFRRSVGRLIVEDDVHLLARILTDNCLHEREEVRRRVRIAQAMGDLAGCDLQRGVEVENPVALVIVGVSRREALAQWEGKLRAFQRLNRRLLVDAQDSRVGGRIEVQTDDVMHLGQELGIATHLVRPHSHCRGRRQLRTCAQGQSSNPSRGGRIHLRKWEDEYGPRGACRCLRSRVKGPRKARNSTSLHHMRRRLAFGGFGMEKYPEHRDGGTRAHGRR